MPILGIIASSRAVAVPNSYESIATVTVGGGGTATVTFSSIPATYTHLQVRCLAKSDNAGTSLETVSMTINGNSLTKNHYLYANGSVVLAGVGGSNVVMNTSSAGSTNIFGVAVIDILDYQNTNKNKTIRTLNGVDLNGSGELVLYSNLYAVNTNAITSLSFNIPTLNIAQYSQFALYGIKGA
jgi:hypothetical protein